METPLVTNKISRYKLFTIIYIRYYNHTRIWYIVNKCIKIIGLIYINWKFFLVIIDDDVLIIIW